MIIVEVSGARLTAADVTVVTLPDAEPMVYKTSTMAGVVPVFKMFESMLCMLPSWDIERW